MQERRLACLSRGSSGISVCMERHPPASAPTPTTPPPLAGTYAAGSMSGSTGARLALAVAGAHLEGLRLNHQLTSLGATKLRACRTAPIYSEPAGCLLWHLWRPRCALMQRQGPSLAAAPPPHRGRSAPPRSPPACACAAPRPPAPPPAHTAGGRQLRRAAPRPRPLRGWPAEMFSLGPKPALMRQPEGETGGAAIEVELWELPIESVGCAHTHTCWPADMPGAPLRLPTGCCWCRGLLPCPPQPPLAHCLRWLAGRSSETASPLPWPWATCCLKTRARSRGLWGRRTVRAVVPIGAAGWRGRPPGKGARGGGGRGTRATVGQRASGDQTWGSGAEVAAGSVVNKPRLSCPVSAAALHSLLQVWWVQRTSPTMVAGAPTWRRRRGRPSSRRGPWSGGGGGGDRRQGWPVPSKPAITLLIKRLRPIPRFHSRVTPALSAPPSPPARSYAWV